MSMNEHEKKRHTVWLPEDIWNEVERLYQDDNCTSRNEFVEKALRFYVGYLHTDKSSAFLPRVLLDVLEGSLGVFCGRVGKLLFNLAVEHCMAIIVSDMARQEDVTEALKAADQMEWVRRMNSIRNRAEEIVLTELVYE